MNTLNKDQSTNFNAPCAFNEFLRSVADQTFELNTTATGAVTIQQSARNRLRKEGLAALKSDLEALYGAEFDVLETKDGLIIAAENEPGGFTFSWELKNTIKSIDYDPFIEANNFDDEEARKQLKRQRKEEERLERERRLAEARAKRMND